MKRQLKKRQFMKRGMMGIYAAICAGMLLATGCAGTEPNVKKETERIEVTESQESKPVNTASKEAEGEVPEKQEEVQNESLLQIQGGAGNEDLDTMDTFAEDTVFQKGTVKSDGSSYSLEGSEKDGIGDNDFVLCFGKQQADGSYLADRIIKIVFN